MTCVRLRWSGEGVRAVQVWCEGGGGVEWRKVEGSVSGRVPNLSITSDARI